MWTLRTPDGTGDVTSILQQTSIGCNQNPKQRWKTQPSSLRSPRKRRSEEGNKFVFPHGICLFCNKKTTASGGKIFKPTEIFTSWGHKKSGWTNIEQMARDLQNDGYSGLLRKVAGVDLFACEAHFHQPCY